MKRNGIVITTGEHKGVFFGYVEELPDLDKSKFVILEAALDVCHECGSTKLIEYPEDPRYLVCADCGTRK